MATNVLVTPQTVLQLSSSGVQGDIRLSADAWRILTQVDGSHTVGEIAANLNADPMQIVQTARELVRLGLLAVTNQSVASVRSTVNGVFFGSLEKELVNVIGPLGFLLIEEEIAKLGESRDNFPRAQVAELVERVSVQIEDENERVDFQRIMLQAIRKL